MELRYNVSYHLRCQLTLRSGRTITLKALDQEMSYAGLLEGTPNARSNDRYLESSLRAAERRSGPGCKPHLIPPARRDYLREPGDMQPVIEGRPYWIPEWLPMVRCIGSFDGIDPGRGLTSLVVVWFQDEYALPILEPALDHLLALDWDSLAIDTELY